MRNQIYLDLFNRLSPDRRFGGGLIATDCSSLLFQPGIAQK